MESAGAELFEDRVTTRRISLFESNHLAGVGPVGARAFDCGPVPEYIVND